VGFFLSRKWKRQPQGPVEVDLAHPLAVGVGGFLIATPFGFVDACRRTAMATGTGSPLGLPSGIGWSRQYDGDASDRTASSPAAFGFDATSTTVSLVVQVRVDGTGKQGLVHTNDPNGTSGAYFYATNSSGDLTLGLDKAETAAAGSATTAIMGGGGRWQVAGVTYDGATSRFFGNGRSLGTASASTDFSNAAIGIGRKGSLTVERLVGAVAAVIGFKAARPNQVIALTENPYQILRPRTLRIYSLPASGIPVLSGSTVIDIGQTSARPRVTITF
jgi:hypothetical protein